MATATQEPTMMPRPRRDFLGPILRWELVTIPRRMRYFLVRAAYAAVLLVTLWITYKSTFWEYRVFGRGGGSIELFSAFASAFFLSFLWVQTIAVLVLTPAFVASGIAVEKERRTIEYLFATDLTNREIVLGKVLARSLNLVAILLAGVPIVAFAGLFGGIDYFGLLLLTLGSMSVLLSVAALSILVSIHSRTTRQALMSTYAVVLFVVLSPYLLILIFFAISEFLDYLSPPSADAFRAYFETYEIRTVGMSLAALHPMAVAAYLSVGGFVLSQASPGTITYFAAIHVGGHFLLAIVFLAIAIGRLRRAYRFEAGAAAKRPLGPRNIRRFRSRVWEDLPVAWKEIHAGSYRSLGCLARVLVALVGFSFYATFLWSSLTDGDPVRTNIWVREGTVCFAGLAFLAVAFRSATSISQERDRDCWVSLLSTPISAREILVSKWVASLSPVIGTMLFLSPLWLVALALGGLSVIGLVCTVIVLLIYGGMLAALGIYQSLCRRTTVQSIAATLGVAAACCGLIQLFLLPMVYGSESDTAAKFVAASIPWVVVAGAPMSSSDLSGTSIEVEFIAFCVLFAFVYAMLGTALLEAAIGRFPKVTGRSEGRLPRLPPPHRNEVGGPPPFNQTVPTG